MVSWETCTADSGSQPAPLERTLRDPTDSDICLDGSSMPVRFDAAAYCTIMEVERDGTWHHGKLVKLIKGSIVCGCSI